MEKIKLTLQNRITTLLIISSVLFIAVFTFIQINNQISNANSDIIYRANLSSKIAKDNLEGVIRNTPAQEVTSYIQTSLKELQNANMVEDALVFDREGKIIASTKHLSEDESVSYKDIAKIEDLQAGEKEDKWFILTLDSSKKLLDIYIAMKSAAAGPMTHFAKLSFSLASIDEALIAVYRPVIFSSVIVILANIILGYFLSRMVVGPIKALNEVTKIIARGNLGVRTDIRTQDELEELGDTFNYMTEELVKMKERAENANPLTKLPGNIVIHEEVEKLIGAKKKFMVIYCDLDNFKAFNDKYGIAKGDEAIKMAADIFKEAIKIKGTADDFLGHEGGDDFIILTTPEKAQEVAAYITGEFDKRVRALYSEDDLKEGHIIAHARDGTVKQFPIMSISLAGVTNQHRPIASYAEVTNIAAEVKKKAKAIGASVFVEDKRKN